MYAGPRREALAWFCFFRELQFLEGRFGNEPSHFLTTKRHRTELMLAVDDTYFAHR